MSSHDLSSPADSNHPSSHQPSSAVEPKRPDVIRIRGARTHNLQNVDVDIPHHQLTVLTGPSGSGKSSLAFDTIYAEGKRQYIESLSIQARQFLEQVSRPDVDVVEGLPPTLCIDQYAGSRHLRSTVATITEVYDYLRLFLARLGEVHCPQCGSRVHQQSPQEMLRRLADFPNGTKAILMAPMIQNLEGRHSEVFHRVRTLGFVRVRVDGVIHELDDVPELEPHQPHTIEAVVDRIILRPEVSSRLAQSVETTLEHGKGRMTVMYQTPNVPRGSLEWQDQTWSNTYGCLACDVHFDELQPRTFSFNSPYGACPTCQGLGRLERFDPELAFPDKSFCWQDDHPLRKQATKKQIVLLEEMVASFFQHAKPKPTTAFSAYSPEEWEVFLHGDPAREDLGLLLQLENQFSITSSKRRLTALEKLHQVVCPDCRGSRLRPEARNVFIHHKSIGDIVNMAVEDALQWLASIPWTAATEPVGRPLVQAMVSRLTFLNEVGLGYLTLGRAADSLSGGEFQRVRLATSLGSGLVGVCYILDEPSIGLHPRDNERLVEALRHLKDVGNTVLVVEHDEIVMQVADTLIDMGPAAGERGGRIMAAGTPAAVLKHSDSLTGRYLSGDLSIALPASRRPTAKSRSLLLKGVCTHNLQSVDVRFPLGVLLCITGVSGSGKSSLVNGTLAPAILRRFGMGRDLPGPHLGLQGVAQIDKVIRIDQKPIGRSPRSNPATFTGIFDDIRKVFAGTRQAKQWGFRSSRFSFNNKEGRCEACQGAGEQKMEMSFLPDLYVTCEDCGGARFNRQTLAVQYRRHSIADILNLSIDEALVFFENFAHIARYLECLHQVGLGYLRLGQSSTTLSGGEAQRIKLATELARTSTGKTLYLLDEPTTGLHFEDIRRLLIVLQGLVEKGNSVVVIEHNLDVIKCADWVIDLGPEGGRQGGRVVAEGTPEEIAQVTASHTGRFLKEKLAT